jgi:hypothetical protein
MSPSARRTVRRISPHDIRRLFNEGGYERQVAAGALEARVLINGHPTPPRAPEPICTRSQMVGYFDANGRKVVEVHRYVRPDGTIGASGLPDPKRLRVGDILFIVDP